MPKDFLSCL